MSIEAAAGASRTVSPGWASRAACRTTSPMAPVSVRATSTTGIAGACRVSESRISARQLPISTAARNRSRAASTSSSKLSPLPRPPATQTTDGYAASDAAAAALARAYGVLADAVHAGLRGFTPDPHRNALVAVVDQVSYVDDSKATNPHAAAASLAAYPSVVWVAGGLGKGLSFDELVLAARERLRAAVLMGSCRAESGEAVTGRAPAR